MKKRIVSLLTATVVAASAIAATGVTAFAADDYKDAYVIVNKLQDDWFIPSNESFLGYLEENGKKGAELTPVQNDVSQQVDILDRLLTEGAKAIALNCNSDTGYDQILTKYQEAGVPVITDDSAAIPNFRLTHINQADSDTVGAFYVRAGVLTALGVPYDPEDPDMLATVTSALESYEGDPIVIGCMTAQVDAPVQNGWIEGMKKEMENEIYEGKVDKEMDIKYGLDDATESQVQANAYISEGHVDVIVSLSGASTPATGQVIQDTGSDLKVTGCGLASQMSAYMGASADDNPFDYPCPMVVFWDLKKLGAVTAAACVAAAEDGFDGKVGSTLHMNAWDTYEAEDFTVTETADGGTEVIIGDPIIFTPANVTEWVDIL